MSLFNLKILAQNRLRAARQFDPRLFIHAAQQLRDRLDPIRHPFECALDVTPEHTGGLFPFFQDLFSATQWQQVSGVSGAFEKRQEGSFDLIVSALEAHWIDDLPRFLGHLHALLKPGGLLLCTFWGGKTLHELRHALFHADSLLCGGAAGRVSPMLPLEEGVRLLQHVGFTLPVVDQETITALYPTLRRLIEHLRAMGETNALANRFSATRTLFQEAERFYKDTYATKAGDLPATFQLITLTGWKDAPDQPQPLRPGSATHHLSDLL